MSEAVVDDIVAVLPPLLQSLEALSFIARHLNPPDFGRVMEAAGTPDQALQAVRARLADWPEEFARFARAAGDRERCGAGGIRGIARGAERQWRPDRGVSRAAPRPARAGGAVSAVPRNCRRSANFFLDPPLARRRRPAGAAGAAGATKTPASFTTTTSPAAAAATRSTFRNTTRPIAPGRW